MCVQSGSGEFVAVIDLEGFKWSNSLPIPLIKDAVTLLKRHYPYRLGGVFIINGSAAFTLLWSIIKPIMPRKTLSKTFVINKKQIKKTMCEKLGKEFVEEAYGGDVKEDHGDVIKYFASGYWGK
jgi:CRAL/TRIO domain